jgi:MFS family permease
MKLDYKRTVIVGLAFLSISAFWQLYDFIIPLMLRSSFGVGDTLAGFVMSIDNILALFMLPLFGALSDRTSNPMGRRKPYILYGTIGAVVAMMAIPAAAHERSLALFVPALGLVLIAMATYRSPAVALMPDITPKPLRSKGNAVINLMGALGGASVLLLTSFLAPKTSAASANYWPLFIAVGAIMGLGVSALMAFVNEPKLVKKMREDSAAMGIDPEEAREGLVEHGGRESLEPGQKRSMGLILASIALWFMGYNAVTTAFSKYAVFALGMEEKQASLILMVAIVAATLAFIPVGFLSSRLGRKKTILAGIAILSAVFGSAALYTSFSPLMYVSFSLAGIGWAAINVNSLPMVLEMSKGASVGKYTGYYYTFSMAAQVVTPILSGALLEHVGYWTLLPYGALFVALSFLTMLTVRHGDSKPLAKDAKLEALSSED